MSNQRFDNLCRALAAGTSRRGLLKAIGGGIAGTVATAALTAPVGATPPNPNGRGSRPYDRHIEDGQICTKFDDNGDCVCHGAGHSCNLDADCCSGFCGTYQGSRFCKP